MSDDRRATMAVAALVESVLLVIMGWTWFRTSGGSMLLIGVVAGLCLAMFFYQFWQLFREATTVHGTSAILSSAGLRPLIGEGGGTYADTNAKNELSPTSIGAILRSGGLSLLRDDTGGQPKTAKEYVNL